MHASNKDLFVLSHITDYLDLIESLEALLEITLNNPLDTPFLLKSVKGMYIQFTWTDTAFSESMGFFIEYYYYFHILCSFLYIKLLIYLFLNQQ